MKEESDDNSEVTTTMPAQVKLPEFWPLKAALWFARADAEFSVKGVTTEVTKYSYTVAALPVEVADRVTDEILSPDPTTPYTNLRQRLLDTYTLDDYQRACSLLDMPARSSEKPSALLDAMLAFLPEEVSRDEPGWLFKNLFLRRLPVEIRAHLMAHTDDTVRQLAVRGDALWSGIPTALPTVVHAVTEQSSDDEAHAPTHSCCAVTHSSSSAYCWYHATYGVDATKCRAPCQWKQRKAKQSGNGRGGRRN